MLEPILDDLNDRIELETTRADCDGHAFTLLFFAPGAEAAEPRDFVNRCEQRLRAGDVWGRVGPDHIGVLLPFTTDLGALRVWERIWQGSTHGPPKPELRYSKERVVAQGSAAPDPAVAVDVWPAPRVEVHPGGVIALLAEPLPRWKRALDVGLGLIGLFLMAPVMAVVALAIKLTSDGPVLFVHERTGRGLTRFPLLKFRTMIPGARKRQKSLASINLMSGPLFKVDRDPRLTSIGHFLRVTSLDELPQLWNVVRGDMSLVGPRALSPPPSEYLPWHLERFLVSPGVACAWQAYHRAETDFDAWMRSDIQYARCPSSLRKDLRLMVAILVSVLRRDGSR